LNDNYTLTYVGANLTIGTRAVEITADAKSKTYGDTDPALTYQITDGSLAFSDDFTGSLTRDAGEDVGDYAITQGTVALNDNYTLTYVGANLTITKATLTVTANDKSREYGNANPTFDATITGFKNGETLATSGVTGTASCTTSATASSPVSGSPYAINCAIGSLASGNYSFTFVAGELTVTQATLTVTANDKSREYGNANPTFDATITGFKNGETLATSGVTGTPSLTSSATASSLVPGPYAITAALGTLAANNYNFIFVNGNLTITKAILTVTADNKTKLLNAPNPAFTFVITGFKNGETASVLTTQPTCTSTAVTSSPVGSYPITCSGASATNYDFTYVSGTLKVFYNFTGFFQPVDNLPALNTVQAGRAIPVKFSLNGNQGLSIFFAGYPVSTPTTCGTTTTDVIETTVTAGSSSLSYDATTNQYNYVWKTDKAWAGTCRTLTVKFIDGTIQQANFKFTK
jgi:MBG domain-containing protein